MRGEFKSSPGLVPYLVKPLLETPGLFLPMTKQLLAINVLCWIARQDHKCSNLHARILLAISMLGMEVPTRERLAPMLGADPEDIAVGVKNLQNAGFLNGDVTLSKTGIGQVDKILHRQTK